MASSENTIITQYRRELLCKATSGAITTTIPKITYIAFGSGGADTEGVAIPPASTQSTLTAEVGRYEIDEVTYPVPTTAAYYTRIPGPDLANVKISEAALLDSTGAACAIRTFAIKIKDPDVVFGFGFNDEF